MVKNNTSEGFERILSEKGVPKKTMSEIKKAIKVISGMAGIEKENLEFKIKNKTVKIEARNGSRNYHAMVPIKPQ